MVPREVVAALCLLFASVNSHIHYNWRIGVDDLNILPDLVDQFVRIEHTYGDSGEGSVLEDEGEDGDEDRLILRLNAFGKNVQVRLNRVNNVLAGENTPVWLASGSNDTEGVTFTRADDHTLGKAVKLYQDRLSDSSIALQRDDNGLAYFTGILSGMYIHYKPSSKQKRALPRTSDGYAVSDYHTVTQVRRKRSTALPDFSTVQLRAKRDAENSNSSTLYPQILVVTNYDIPFTSTVSQEFYDHLIYVLAFWNGVDLLFQQLKEPEVRLHIAGIVVNANPQAAPYIYHNRNGTGYIDADKAIAEMGETYTALNSNEFPAGSFDIIVTLTNEYICNQHEEDFCSPQLAGVSSLSPACLDNTPTVRMVAIVEDNLAFDGIRTTAHELGHIMGAEHDGEEEAKDCNFADGYLMAKYNDSSTVSLTWSKCSKEAFSKYLNVSLAECLRNPPNREKTGNPLPPILPGTIAGLNAQCRALGYVRACQGPQNCQALTCVADAYPFSTKCEKAGVPAAQGSFCGTNHHCINGYCGPIL